MKKVSSIFLLFFAFLFVGVSVSSCSSDDEVISGYATDMFIVDIQQDFVNAKVDDQISFTAVVKTYKSNQAPSQAVPVENPALKWTSDNTSLLSIDPSTGKAEALSGGEVKVIATVGDATDTCHVSIAPLTDIFIVDIPQDTVKANEGDQISFSAVVTTYKSNQDPSQAVPATNQPVKWTSDNTSLLTIDPSTGKADALAAGTVKVIASIGNAADTCYVIIAPSLNNTHGVYICGYENNDNWTSVATVWKDGSPIRLSDGSTTAEARACCVDGNDLYVVGYVNNDDYKSVATVWKNGSLLYKLGSDDQDSRATGVAVKDGDVYVAGNSFDANGVAKCTLWKNGVATYLSSPSAPSIPTSAAGNSNSLFIDGDNIYVGGMVTDNNANVSYAAVWKNGVATVYPDGSGQLKVNYMFVKNNVPYLTGTLQSNGNGIAQIWIDGVLTQLSDGSNVCEAYSVGFIGSDMYVSGGRFNASYIAIPMLWKNGVSSDLTDGTKNSYACALTTFGNDLYIAGTELNENYVNQVKLWKNGVASYITDGKYYTYVFQVYVN